MKAILGVFSFDLLSKALLGVIAVLLIRFMPEVEYARYTLALALINVPTEIIVKGINRIYIVGYERLELKERSSVLLGFQVVVICALIVLALPLILYLGRIYWVVVGMIIVTCLSEFSKTYFQRELRFIRFSMIELFRSFVVVCSLLVLIGLVRYGLKAEQVLFVQTISILLVFLATFSSKIKLLDFLQYRSMLNLASSIFRGEYRYLFGYFGLLAFFSQLDVFMLRLIANDLELATYGSAFRYYMLVVMVLSAVHVVLLPVIQQVESTTQLEGILHQHKKTVMLFCPIVFIGAWGSEWIIPLIDMGKYPSAVAVFRILSISAVISLAYSPHVNIVLRFEDFRFLFFLISTGLLLNFGLNIVLITKLGAIGAAIATLFAFGFINGSIFLRARIHRNALASVK